MDLNAGIPGDDTIYGRLVDFSGHAYLEDVEVGISGIRPDGEKFSVLTRTNADAEFTLDVPKGPVSVARIAAGIDGIAPVELEVIDGEVVPGEVIFTVAFEMGSHLRFGGA